MSELHTHSPASARLAGAGKSVPRGHPVSPGMANCLIARLWNSFAATIRNTQCECERKCESD